MFPVCSRFKLSETAVIAICFLVFPSTGGDRRVCKIGARAHSRPDWERGNTGEQDLESMLCDRKKMGRDRERRYDFGADRAHGAPIVERTGRIVRIRFEPIRGRNWRVQNVVGERMNSERRRLPKRPLISWRSLCRLTVVSVLMLVPDWSELGRGLVPRLSVSESHQTLRYWYFAVGIFSAMLMEYEVHFYSSGALEEDWTAKDLPENFMVASFGSVLGAMLKVALLTIGALVFFSNVRSRGFQHCHQWHRGAVWPGGIIARSFGNLRLPDRRERGDDAVGRVIHGRTRPWEYRFLY